MDVGTELAEARKTRALSVQDLSRRTKIAVSSLEAIERGDVAQLPGGIFTRGFVRAYAREVGCDPETTVARFVAEYGERPGRAGASPPDREAELPAACKSGQLHVADIDLRDQRQSRAAWARLAAIVAVLAVTYWGFQNTRQSEVAHPGSGTEEPPHADVSHPARAVGTVGVPEERGDVSLQPAARVNRLQLDIEPDGPCWLTAPADGHRVVYRVLAAGERTSIEAQDGVALRVGDAGRFRFSVNGQPGRTLGAAGQALTVAMTPENYREFLATR